MTHAGMQSEVFLNEFERNGGRTHQDRPSPAGSAARPADETNFVLIARLLTLALLHPPLAVPTMSVASAPIALAALIASTTPLMSTESSVTSIPWGNTKDGTAVELWTLRNTKGMEAQITTYGGILVSLTAPDRTGQFADIVLGKSSLAEYEAGHPFFGAITGRYANRIGGAKFTLDGVEHHVTPTGNGSHSLHGGKAGFDKKVWKAVRTEKAGAAEGLALHYLSADGEEGYPGKLDCTVKYVLSDDNELIIEYTATTDKPTVLNLTNHSYFNLAGEGSGTALKHELTLFANAFTATDDDLIPTGELTPVTGTPLDFTAPHVLGERIDADYNPLRQGIGYDHNFVVSGKPDTLRICASVRDPSSGRVMDVLTTCPGVQLYTANHLKDVTGKHGHVYQKRDAFCLETQHFPDSPNKPQFPSTVLRPGQTYNQQTRFRFRAE